MNIGINYMLDKTGYMDVEVLVDEFLKVKQESKDEIARLERENKVLKAQLQELNLQYISDFGQLQEREPAGTVASLFDEAIIAHCGFDRDHLVYLSPKPKE